MSKQSILTLTPDYNRPADADGFRTELVRSRWIIEDVKSGQIKVGDPVFLYFDPEGEESLEYEAGYGITGTIQRLEIRAPKFDAQGTEYAWVTYSDDFD
jgi:hypothetical protein